LFYIFLTALPESESEEAGKALGTRQSTCAICKFIYFSVVAAPQHFPPFLLVFPSFSPVFGFLVSALLGPWLDVVFMLMCPAECECVRVSP